jgi:hypothetical protein
VSEIEPHHSRDEVLLFVPFRDDSGTCRGFAVHEQRVHAPVEGVFWKALTRTACIREQHRFRVVGVAVLRRDCDPTEVRANERVHVELDEVIVPLVRQHRHTRTRREVRAVHVAQPDLFSCSVGGFWRGPRGEFRAARAELHFAHASNALHDFRRHDNHFAHRGTCKG